MPKVSVIIPIYGVEKYIERCAKSLLEQTLEDMEFIFVNDCTEDKSLLILNNVIKNYPNRNNQIKVLSHERNKGLSYARETGVNAANGEYIAHCDSDDWVKSNMYEELYDYAKLNNLDFVKSGRICTDGKKIFNEEFVYTENNKVDNDSVIKYLLLEKGWNSIWNTLIKRTVYEESNVEYTPYAMLEDFFLVTQLLLHSRRIGVLNKNYYYYFQNSNSISRRLDEKSVVKNSMQAENNIKKIIEFIHNKYGGKFKEEELSLTFMPCKILIPIMYKKKNLQYWRMLTSECMFRFLINRYIPFIYKLWYIEARLGLKIIFG